MGGVYGEINGRADFDAVLGKAVALGNALLDERPGDSTIEVILRQLESVQQWCSNGRTPSEAERESIDIGLRASRELEGDNEAYSWAQLLYSLDAYIEDWPTDNEAATATDDDFFASDED